MNQLFYAPDLPDSDLLPESESHHLHRVMRMETGSEIHATDGKGSFFRLKTLGLAADRMKVELLSQESDPHIQRPVHIAVAPTKQMDRFEWLVEKCVELGAIRFSPIICARSERRKLRIDRLQRIALSAMKQSLRSRLPEIDAPMTFDAFLEEYKDKDLLLAHCEQGQKRTLNEVSLNNAPVLCIGPEGDFSPGEIEKARAMGASMIDLGNYRLRTETAAVHGCSLLAAALR